MITSVLFLLLGAVGQQTPLDEVVTWMRQGRLEESVAELQQQLAMRESADARGLLGVALARLGRVDAAEAELRRAIELAPSNADWRSQLARVALGAGRHATALEQLRALAEANALDPDLALEASRLEREAGRAERAVEILRKLTSSSDTVRGRLALARLLYDLGQPQEAMRELASAIAEAPNSEEILTSYARSALAAQQPGPAASVLGPLVRMHPEVAEHAYLLGVAYMQLGDMATALDSLERAARLDPSRPLTLIALGLARNQEKLYSEAVSALEQARRLAPGSIEAHAALAEAYEGQDFLEQAEDSVQRVLGEAPEHAGANLTLGSVRLKQGRLDEATVAFERSLSADPDNAKTYYQLSLAEARRGNRDLSASYLEQYREAQRRAENRNQELRQAPGPVARRNEP